jgi:hypothetical protein
MCYRLSLLERREIEGPKKHLLTPAAGSAESCTLQLWQGMEHGEVQSRALDLRFCPHQREFRVGADAPSAQPSEARLEASPTSGVASDEEQIAAAGLAPGRPDEGISTPSSQKRA